MEDLIKIEHLSVSFHTHLGEVQAVRDVSFQIPDGACVAVVGESGCGKTVTAKTIMGLMDYFAGEVKRESRIWFHGENILDYTKKQWQAFRGGTASMIFQDAMVSLNPILRIGDQIAEALRLHQDLSRRESWRRAVELLEQVGIHDAAGNARRYPHEFSGGMRQRAMIAMAIACDPLLLIADEPTTALDVTMQAQIIDLLKRLQAEKKMSVLFITHDLGIVSGMAQYIVVMYNGTVVETGTLEDIFYRKRHPYTEAMLHSALRIDRGKDQTLYAIEGAPPSLIRPPVGCPFARRCPYAMNICTQARPEMQELEEGHFASCWKYMQGRAPVSHEREAI